MHKKIALLLFFPSALFGMFDDLLDENYRTESRIREERIQSAQQKHSSIQGQCLALRQNIEQNERIFHSLQTPLIQNKQEYDKQHKELSNSIQTLDPETIPTKLEKKFQEQTSTCQKKIEKIVQGFQAKRDDFKQQMEELTESSKKELKALAVLNKAIKNDSQKLAQLQTCIALFSSKEAYQSTTTEAPPSYEACEKEQEEICTPGPSAPSEDTPPGYVQSYGSCDKDEA